MTTDPITSKYIPDVPVAKISLHPDNPRHDVGDIDDLAKSIKDHGVLEPLVVVHADDVDDDTLDSGCVLIAGHRRLAAAELANVSTVPVIVRYDLATRDAQVAAMVIENQHRADLSPVEEGEAYQLLLDITPKSTQATVAAAVGMPKKRVSERVRLTKLGDNAKAAIHDGQITLTDALDLLAVEARHPDLAEKAALAAGTRDFKFELSRAKQDADTLDRYDQYRAKAEELDTVILGKAPGYQPGQPRRVDRATRGITVPDDLTATALIHAIGEAHASCPGAAVYIPKQASSVYELGWYCTAFEDHHTASPEERRAERAEQDAAWERQQAEREQARLDAMTDEERAAEERKAAEAQAARQAKQDRVDGLKAAQATRWAHFIDVITQGETALAKWAVIDSLGTGDDSVYIDAFSPMAKALLVSIPDEASDDDVLSALHKLTLEQIALLQWFLVNDYWDKELTAIDAVDGYYATQVARYIAALTDRFGYQWSTVEIEEFDIDEHGHVRTDDEDETDGGEAA